MALSQSSPSTSSIPTTTTAPPSISLLPSISATLASSFSSEEASTARTAPSAPDKPAPSPRSSLHNPSKSSRQSNNHKHRQSTASASATTSSSKQSRAGLFTLARERTSNALASFASEPTIRSRPSSNSLYPSPQSSPTTSLNNSSSLSQSVESQKGAQDFTEHSRTSSSNISASTPPRSKSESQYPPSIQRQSLLETDPPSQAYTDTTADKAPRIESVPSGNYNKMHQTSSRLLRMTTDDRPFTRVSNAAETWEEKRTNNLGIGFQRFICYIGCQSTASPSPREIDAGGPFILIGGSYQQLGISEVLAIQPHARSKGSVADSDNHHDDHVLYGPRDGSICLPEIPRRKVY